MDSPRRYDSDIKPINGIYRALFDGVFILEFDNVYSMLTPKLITYNAELSEPGFDVEEYGTCAGSNSVQSGASISIEGVKNSNSSIFESFYSSLASGVVSASNAIVDTTSIFVGTTSSAV